MKVLITGANGQLGYELQRTKPESVALLCTDSAELDITNPASVKTFIHKESPDAVINAAAYTAVDKAEADSAQAYKVNADGPEVLALACEEKGISMVQVSTDFVFDGTQSTPYKPDDKPAPVSVYGDSKLKGEHAVATTLGNNAAIIRTAWVYSAHGNNFVKTMLRLMQEKEQLGIVADQIGTPTWANTLAQACWQALEKLVTRHSQRETIYHWTDAGAASWYDFAVAIQKEALTLGILNKAIPINPIPASAYPTPAKRPSFSVLDKTGSYTDLHMQPTHWRENLREMLQELKHSL